MAVLLYGHGGSEDHGCEAILRTTAAMLEGEQLWLASEHPAEDKAAGVEEIATIIPQTSKIRRLTPAYLRAYMRLHLRGEEEPMEALRYRHALPRSTKLSLAIDVGGDSYGSACATRTRVLHTVYARNGIPTVLWNCSIEPSLLENSAFRADLAQYALITARESITYHALRQVNHHVIQVPDPAFSLPVEEMLLPTAFHIDHTVGINLSPALIRRENAAGTVLESFRQLIRHILAETDLQVALIPYVVRKGADDRALLDMLYTEFEKSERVFQIPNCSCMQLKGYISRCRFFVGARTNAVIDAYASCIPTLTVGYSVKARGIARDIFGTENGYVVPVQSLRDPAVLTSAFDWLTRRECGIRSFLRRHMPEYCCLARSAADYLEEVNPSQEHGTKRPAAVLGSL